MLHRIFLPALFLKALVMIAIILYAGIGLGPDEAQYWTWSRHLDVGYYSKPPGIAWQIFLSTFFIGQTELGVRFSAVVLGTLFSLSVYRLARKSGCSKESSALAGLISSLTPLGIFSTFLAITDGGLILFWTLGLTELSFAIYEKKAPSYFMVGLFIAFGALFKWPIYLLWLVAFIALWFYPFLRSKTIFGAILISLLGLLPTLIWNVEHDFATFRHVFTTVQGGNDGGAKGNPLEFIGSQIGLISPIIFILGCISLVGIQKQRTPIIFLGSTGFAILSCYLAYSCFKKGQGNWCLFAYPSLFVLIAEDWLNNKKWIGAGIGLSLILVAGVFLIPEAEKRGVLIPWKINPFRHNLGFDVLHQALENFDKDTQFLFSDKYQTTSQLSFYNPNQEQSYFFNLLGSRKNQFSYWPGPEKGKEGIFVAIESAPYLDKKMKEMEAFYLEKLKSYFLEIKPPKRVVLFSIKGEPTKEALFFPCEGYLGRLPIDPEKY